MKKPKSDAVTRTTPAVNASTGKETAGASQVGQRPSISTVPNTIHTPIDGGRVVSDRAYVFINVHPGRTSDVTRALYGIKQIKTIDPCWGKPDIIVVVEVSDQDAMTQLVLSRIHEIDGVSQTETHLVYRLKASNAA
jgi:DNA-binding Lrp family transcriptional regulator